MLVLMIIITKKKNLSNKIQSSCFKIKQLAIVRKSTYLCNKKKDPTRFIPRTRPDKIFLQGQRYASDCEKLKPGKPPKNSPPWNGQDAHATTAPHAAIFTITLSCWPCSIDNLLGPRVDPGVVVVVRVGRQPSGTMHWTMERGKGRHYGCLRGLRGGQPTAAAAMAHGT